jgi:hypothetical protein
MKKDNIGKNESCQTKTLDRFAERRKTEEIKNIK